MHLDLPTYFGNKGNHASLNQLLGQVRVNAGLLSGARDFSGYSVDDGDG